MLFSVVIPVLNEKKYLPRCLDALTQQQFARDQYELIFVDNGSTDGSLEFLQAQPKVKLLRQETRDAYLARNSGIQAAQGKYVVFTDADCVVAKNWLARFAEEVEGSAPGILVGRLSFPTDCSSFVRYYENYYATKMQLFTSELPRECCFGHAGNMAVRTDLFNSLGLFSGMPIVGDTEIVQKFLVQYPDEPFVYVDDAEVRHLEVSTGQELLKKLYHYGIYTETLQHLSDFCLSAPASKLRTFSECVRRYRYGLPQCLALGGALLVQQVAFFAGCYWSKLRRFARMPRMAGAT